MQALGRGILILGMVLMVGGWLTGIVNYFRIFAAARAQGRGFWELYWFGAYRFAFNEMKGSPETRWMVRGFLSVIGGVIVAAVGGVLLGG